MSSNKTKPMMKSGPPRKSGPPPIKATQHFQLLQGSPARKSPSSSPTPRSATDGRVAVRSRWSPDHRASPDRNDRKSPSSPSIKVSNRRSPSPSIRRTASLDTIAGPYLTGQWPRDFVPIQHHVGHTLVVCNKMTQTPDWSTEVSTTLLKPSAKSNHPLPLTDPGFNKMRQQIKMIGKRSQHKKKDRSPPIHGDHSAFHQIAAATHPRSISNPISIGGQPFGRRPQRQNSVEALNKEIDMLINKDAAGNEPRIFQGVTPPDGHRAPLPRSSTRTMETQTPQGYTEYSKESNTDEIIPSPTPSPTVEIPTLPTVVVDTQIPQTQITIIAANETKDSGVSPCPKFASSPRPNNSYMFKREPPEGAESVKPFKELDIQQQQLQISPSCPDKNKVNFHPKQTSAFKPAPKSKYPHLKNTAGINGATEQNNNTNLVSINANNNSTVSQPGSNNLSLNVTSPPALLDA
uniref:protein FAM117B isoform X1 n=1 Tax=Ciona intestinalis TaxID=7719 RepID=UPI00005239E8|nr:protein FAM117B isoform X1 [Ciona intestinalis]|eukprot:XP_002132100.1 protein FAM117B isoform X1 [Ciona intestinalis]